METQPAAIANLGKGKSLVMKRGGASVASKTVQPVIQNAVNPTVKAVIQKPAVVKKVVSYPPVPLGLSSSRLAICSSQSSPVPEPLQRATVSTVSVRSTSVALPSTGGTLPSTSVALPSTSVTLPPATANSMVPQQQVDIIMRRLESLMRSMEILKAQLRDQAATLGVIVKSTRPPEIDKTYFRSEFGLPMKTTTDMENTDNLLKDDLIRTRWVIIYQFYECYIGA